MTTALVFEELASPGRGRSSPGGSFELAWGVPLNDDGGEGFIGVRAGLGERFDHPRSTEHRLVAPFVKYRGFAGGDETWKTFLDVGAQLRIQPIVAGIVRFGAGVQL